MNPKYKTLCDRIDAVNAEFRLRRQIELTTGRTPEMLAQYAARRPLPEATQLLLEAWQDAAQAMQIAIKLHEESKLFHVEQKGDEGDEKEPEQ